MTSITVETDGGKWDWVRNDDGSWMGPLEGDDHMTTEEVWQQIQKVISGELS